MYLIEKILAFEMESRPMPMPSASDDLEIAKALQAEYDRENRELGQQNVHNRFLLPVKICFFGDRANNAVVARALNCFYLEQEFRLSQCRLSKFEHRRLRSGDLRSSGLYYSS
jgi:hypothetical protein